MKILDSGPEHLETGSLGKFSLKKKKCEISHLGGGLAKIGSFSHFFYFFLLCPKIMQICKEIFF